MDRSDSIHSGSDGDGGDVERRDRPVLLIAGLTVLTAMPMTACGLLAAGVWLRNPQYSALAVLLCLLNCGLGTPWGGLVAIDADLPKWSRLWGDILAVVAPLLLGCVVAISVARFFVP